MEMAGIPLTAGRIPLSMLVKIAPGVDGIGQNYFGCGFTV